jgi:hypothetical protein
MEIEKWKKKMNGTWILCCCRTPASCLGPPRHSFRLHLKSIKLRKQPYLLQGCHVFVFQANKTSKTIQNDAINIKKH